MLLAEMLGALILTIAVYLYLHKDNTPDEPLSREIRYTYDLHESIQMIAAIDKEIQLIDDLLQNVEHGADTDILHSVSISWKWYADKESKELSFPCYMESREKLLQLAYYRRRELITHLSAELDKMPIRHRQNVDKTIDNIIAESAEKTAGEERT